MAASNNSKDNSSGKNNKRIIEIARDIAKNLIEGQSDEEVESKLANIDDNFDYPLVVGI